MWDYGELLFNNPIFLILVMTILIVATTVITVIDKIIKLLRKML